MAKPDDKHEQARSLAEDALAEYAKDNRETATESGAPRIPIDQEQEPQSPIQRIWRLRVALSPS